MTDTATGRPREVHERSALATHLPRLVAELEPAERVWSAPATLVFADVSGFTRLSERLAKRGRVGSEEVTAAMNGAFTDLLAAAGAEGGDLLKFGGDALLLLFTGRHHEARACRAGLRMQQALAARPAVPAPGGPVRLRMTVGVHSDVVTVFVAGDSHVELVVTGPAATAVVERESAANPGQVLASPATASAAGATTRRLPVADAVAVTGVAPGGVPFDTGVEPQDGHERFVPPALRGRLGTFGEGDHRQAGVAFVRFRGTDDLLRKRGSAGVAEPVHRLVCAAQRAAARHGVAFLASDIDADGGKLIVTAGAPDSADDDAGRLLRFAADVATENGELGVGVGVHRGPVFAGEVGAPWRRSYTVMGDTVNTAARLAARASPGEVLASAAVLDRSEARFERRAVGALHVKGKVTAIEAAVVGREHVTPARAVPAPSGPALVGRTSEVAAVVAAAQAARAGTGTTVTLVGDAGIGKTRIVVEAAAATPGAEVHRAFGARHRQATPWWIAGQLLASTLGHPPAATAALALEETVARRAPELTPWTPLLALALGVDVEPTAAVRDLHPQFVPARLAEVTGRYLDAVLPRGALLVVEQAQWVDDASAGLLRTLASTDERAWSIVAVRRPGDGGFEPEGTRVEVGPLPVADATALAEALLTDRPRPRHRVEQLVALSGGNPMFLRELLDGDQADGDLPESIEAAVTARIDALAPRERTLLRDLSVLGVSFERRLAVAALGPEGAVDLDGPLAAFLDGDGEELVWFRQELVRSVAYGGLPFARRRRLHEVVANVLRRETLAGRSRDVAMLSEHAAQAGLADEAWTWSVVAADRAAEEHALADAVRLYRQALATAPDVRDEERGAVEERAGDVLERLGEPEAADDLWRRAARRLADDPVAIARLRRKRAMVREATGRLGTAMRWLSRARADALAIDDARARAAALAAVENDVAGVHRRRGRLRACARSATAAIAAAVESGERAAEGRGWYLLESVWADEGRLDLIENRALPIFEEVGDLLGQARSLNNMGLDAYYQGRWSDAASLYDRAVGLAERAGDVVTAATVENNLGELLADRGLRTQASARFRAALQVFRGAAYPIGVALTTSNLGRLAAAQGRHDEALAVLHDALERFRAIDARWYIADTQARIAEALVLAGRADDAAPFVEDAVRTAGDEAGPLEPLLRRTEGWVALLRAKGADAAERFEASIAAAQRFDNRYEEALGLLSLAASHPPGLERERDRARAWELLDAFGVVSVPLPVGA